MSSKPTLIDKRGMGGVIALEGFDYQRWEAICRLPAWIKNPAFEGLTIEGLEDFEARFFSPHSVHGHVLERFQAKSGNLTRSDVLNVFQLFQKYDESFPSTTLMQTLVTPAMPAGLKWIETHSGRIERSRTFYQPFTGILSANDQAYQAKLEKEFSGPLGQFVAQKTNVYIRTFVDFGAATSSFANALDVTFPDADLGFKAVKSLFERLNNTFTESSGSMVSRKTLTDIFGDFLKGELLILRSLPVRILSDTSPEIPDCIDIDARAFSGGSVKFPEPNAWLSDVIDPLMQTANWSRNIGCSRITLLGRYRLSTAFAVGSAFRSTSGFEIEIPTRDGVWKTDDHPMPNKVNPEWSIDPSTQLVDGRLVVAVGILRDPSQDIQNHLELCDATQIMRLFLPVALTSAEEVQSSIQIIKSSISSVCADLNPRTIDLYLAGPAAFAVALGHRWNGMTPTQLFEFVSGGNVYTPTVRIS